MKRKHWIWLLTALACVLIMSMSVLLVACQDSGGDDGNKEEPETDPILKILSNLGRKLDKNISLSLGSQLQFDLEMTYDFTSEIDGTHAATQVEAKGNFGLLANGGKTAMTYIANDITDGVPQLIRRFSSNEKATYLADADGKRVLENFNFFGVIKTILDLQMGNFEFPKLQFANLLTTFSTVFVQDSIREKDNEYTLGFSVEEIMSGDIGALALILLSAMDPQILSLILWLVGAENIVELLASIPFITGEITFKFDENDILTSIEIVDAEYMRGEDKGEFNLEITKLVLREGIYEDTDSFVIPEDADEYLPWSLSDLPWEPGNPSLPENPSWPWDPENPLWPWNWDPSDPWWPWNRG